MIWSCCYLPGAFSVSLVYSVCFSLTHWRCSGTLSPKSLHYALRGRDCIICINSWALRWNREPGGGRESRVSRTDSTVDFFQPCLHLISRRGLQATLWSNNLRVAWLCRGNSALFLMPFLVMKWATNPVLFALWLQKLCEQLNSCEASRTSNWASLLESIYALETIFIMS